MMALLLKAATVLLLFLQKINKFCNTPNTNTNTAVSVHISLIILCFLFLFLLYMSFGRAEWFSGS